MIFEGGTNISLLPLVLLDPLEWAALAGPSFDHKPHRSRTHLRPALGPA